MKAALPFLTLALALLLVPPSSAQERAGAFPRASPNAGVQQTIGVTDVAVTYGRPSARGRDLFGGLEPYGRVWRTGANEATTVTFSTDVEVEGEPLAAGTYGLFTVPGEERWTVIFNEEPAQWGAYNYDEGRDALRVEVDPETAPHQEQLLFRFDEVTDEGAELVMHWGETAVPMRLSVPTTRLVLAQADAAIEGSDDWRTPAQYASFALGRDEALDRALGWIEMSVEREATYANMALHARVLAALDRHDDAVEAGERALEQAASLEEAPRGLDDFRAEVESWRAM